MTRTKRTLVAVVAVAAVGSAAAGSVGLAATDGSGDGPGYVTATAVATAYPVTETATTTTTVTVPGPTVIVPGPTTTVTVAPSPSSSSTPTQTTPPSPTTTPAAGGLDGPTELGVYLAGNADPESTYSDVAMSSIYAGAGKAMPKATIKARIDEGQAVHVCANVAGSTYSYVNGLVAGEATATSWLTQWAADAREVSDYATAKRNGTYVVFCLINEPVNQKWTNGEIPGLSGAGSDADAAQIGKAMQVYVRAIDQAAPNAFTSIWFMGYSVAEEKIIGAQVANPKPDVLAIDPYENGTGTRGVAARTAGSATSSYAVAAVKANPAYNGHWALSEYGMSTGNHTDDQLAAYYASVPADLDAMAKRDGVRCSFAVMFNSKGSYTHDITSGYPKAKAALQSVLTDQ